MLTAITGMAPEWFIPSSQVDEDEPARFKLMPLDQLTFLEVVTLSTLNENDMLIPGPDARRLIFKRGLIGWEKIVDSNGKKLKYSPHSVRGIPFQALTEICNRVVLISVPTEEARKN